MILCKQLALNFNAEELRSIRKDLEDIQRLIDDLSEFMPKEKEPYGTINISNRLTSILLLFLYISYFVPICLGFVDFINLFFHHKMIGYSYN